MPVTAQLCKGAPVATDKLEKGKVYNVATTGEGVMSLEYVGPHTQHSPWLVFKQVNGNKREVHIHPNSIFFDPKGPPQDDIVFDPDNPDDVMELEGEEDGADID
jgi:hypothetical protein